MYCINSNICNLFPSFYLFFLLTLLFSIFNCNVKWNKEKKLKEYKKPTLVPEVFFLFSSNLTEKKNPGTRLEVIIHRAVVLVAVGKGGIYFLFIRFVARK